MTLLRLWHAIGSLARFIEDFVALGRAHLNMPAGPDDPARQTLEHDANGEGRRKLAGAKK
jgi:hypothetical protein